MSWTQEEADKVKAPNDRPREGISDPDLRKSLRLPARRVSLLEGSKAREQQIEARMTAVAAASRMYEGGFLRHEIDIDEFLATAQDLEDWINRA